MLYVGKRFSGREVEEQDHQQTSKLATERKSEWNFQRKEKYIFADGRANINYFPLNLNTSPGYLTLLRGNTKSKSLLQV